MTAGAAAATSFSSGSSNLVVDDSYHHHHEHNHNASQHLHQQDLHINNHHHMLQSSSAGGGDQLNSTLTHLTSSFLFEQVTQTKLLASLILFLITLLCGYLPVRILLNQNYIQYAMFAGGGVLMATAFCHLIPEAHDNYREINLQLLAKRTASAATQHLLNHTTANNHTATTPTHINTADSAHNHTANTLIDQHNHLADNSHQHHHHHHHHASFVSSNDTTSSHTTGGLNVPYLEVTLCCGFFFMYVMEQLMVRFISNHSHESHHHNQQQQQQRQLVVSSSSPDHHHHHPTNSQNNSSTTLISTSNHNNNKSHVASSEVENVIVIRGGGPIEPTNGMQQYSTSSISGSSSSHAANSSMGTEFYKFMRGLLIVSAFGAHSIFDGVAIGAQESVEKVWTIFLAISCHKLIIAAVVGLELYSATLESHLWTMVHLSIFSVMSPIGILLVVLAQNSLHINSNHPTMILLQSFATGTLLYIVFVEILQPKEDHAYEKNKFGKSISLIAGFSLMLLVLTLIDE